MKKIYGLIALSFFLIGGCSSTDYKKIRDEERDKFLSQRDETVKIIESMGDRISLGEALELGERRNSQLKIRRLESEIAKIDKNIAFGNFLPKVTAGISYSQLDRGVYAQTAGVELPMGLDLETRIVDKNFYAGGLGATLPIFTPTAWYLYQGRKKGEDISEEILDLERKKIKVQIINSYYHIAALQGEKEYLEKAIEHGKELVKNSKAALEAESIMPWEYDQSEQFLRSRIFSLSKNKRELAEAKMSFLKLLDLNPLADFQIEEEEKEDAFQLEMQLEEILYSALTNNSLLKINDISHQLKGDMVKMAIANFFPNIALSGGYIRTDNSALVEPLLIQGNLMGALTLFNGFQNINNYKKSKKNLQISEIKKQELGSKILLESVNAFNFYQEMRDNLELAQNNYKISEQKFRQEKIKKDIGMISEEELLRSYTENEKAFSLLKNCQYRYEISLALLELVTGGYHAKK